jgi:hypothetical protein
VQVRVHTKILNYCGTGILPVLENNQNASINKLNYILPQRIGLKPQA